MIDTQWIGHALPSSELSLDRSRLRFFAKAIGENNAVHTDLKPPAQRATRTCPRPPTFCLRQRWTAARPTSSCKP